MENVLHVVFRYFIDTQAGVVRVERLLLHKGDANSVLPTAIAYRSVPRYGYCVSCTVPCGVYRDTPVHRCIVPALALCSEYMNDVTDNAKNNFGDPWTPFIISCARSVSENVGMLLKNSYVVSDNFELVLFFDKAFFSPLTCNCNGFFLIKKGGPDPQDPPPPDPPMLLFNTRAGLAADQLFSHRPKRQATKMEMVCHAKLTTVKPVTVTTV